MIRTFPYYLIRKRLAEQRRCDLQKRIDLLWMVRRFESAGERRNRLALEDLRRQDWK